MLNPPLFDFDALPPETREVLHVLRKKNIRFWLIGGFVRDWIGSLPDYRDIDIAVKANVYKIHHLVGGELVCCKHPHVLYKNMELLPCQDIDLALQNRDFTCNALALDEAGRLLDPWAGLEDARAGIFRMTTREGLARDLIRIVRGCRLAARLGWQIENETDLAFRRYIRRMRWKRMGEKYGLKIAVELHKAFEDEKPSLFFKKAHEYGLIKGVIPVLEPLFADAGRAAKALALCDAAPRRDAVRRMFILLKGASAGIKRKTFSQKARKYLQDIHWDEVASGFGRQKLLGTVNDMDLLLLWTVLNLEDERDILALAKSGDRFHCTLERYAAMRERIGENPVSAEKMQVCRQALLAAGENALLPDHLRLSALRFYGCSKRNARKRVRASQCAQKIT